MLFQEKKENQRTEYRCGEMKAAKSIYTVSGVQILWISFNSSHATEELLLKRLMHFQA